MLAQIHALYIVIYYVMLIHFFGKTKQTNKATHKHNHVKQHLSPATRMFFFAAASTTTNSQYSLLVRPWIKKKSKEPALNVLSAN